MENVIYAFPVEGKVISCQSYGSGHINRTFKVDMDNGRSYILQGINTYVFKDPVKLMENISSVTNFLRTKSSDPYCTLHFLQDSQGNYCHIDAEGQCWRMYEFVPGFGLDAPESDEDFYQSALAFGRFQGLLSDFPAQTLHETIPEFHNTIDRFRQLKDAIAADAKGRAASVQEEIRYALAQEEFGSTLQRMRQSGQLPLRVTHNDTKLNNVLLNSQTRESLCVIDLDTVMPGLSAYDFGDSIRFGAATSTEDETEKAKITMDLHLFEVYTKGFLEAAPSLTDLEVKMLPVGALIMTLEVGIRFLADYLNGDVYFRTKHPEHNLERARNQLTLFADMYSKKEEMDRIVAKIAAQVRG